MAGSRLGNNDITTSQKRGERVTVNLLSRIKIPALSLSLLLPEFTNPSTVQEQFVLEIHKQFTVFLIILV